jgi:predicted ribosome quality control (RQC) complex YloA/Tae2 family protein
MNHELLSSIVEELSSLITNARVERVYQGSGGGIYVLLQRDRKKCILLLSPDCSLPRLHLVSDKPAADATPHSFVLYLRSHVTGAKVVQVALLNQDRVVEIRFGRQEIEYRLVFELIGTSANLILTDSSSNILAVYYPGTLSANPVRTLMPGFQYALPDKKRINESRKDLPNIATDSPNKEAESLYHRLIEQRTRLLVRQELQACIRKALSKIERRVAALSRDLQSADQAEQYRQAGDLVLANLDRLKTGMEEADLAGYDGTSVRVQLDPKLSPARNAERLFKKYKKAKAGHAIITQRLHQSKKEASSLTSLQSNLEQARDEHDLAEVRSALVAKGYLKSKGKEKVPLQPATPYRTIFFRDWEILVGKGAKGNDLISTKIARPDDLWLHAEGMPGSHVLVKNPEKRDIPAEVLVKAAALAAYYSKGKTAGKVSVTYTRAGLVKKPKGAKPGLVTISERKSIMVKPEEG